jgi:hypothetical protein
MPELPQPEDRIESPSAPRRPWVAPALTLESVDHTSGKQFHYVAELSGSFGPAS